jgi:general secretion pathway protein N
MLIPSAERTAPQGAALVLAGGVIALAQILSWASAGAEPLQPSSSFATIEPPATVTDAPGGPTKRTGSVARDPKQGGNPLWSLPLSSLSVTRERPIFSPSRRPPSPPAVAAPYVPASPPQPPSRPNEPDHPSLTLLGTLAGDGQGVGIFLNEADKTTLRLRTGENHEGWVLRSIRSGEVTFEKGERIATFALAPFGSAAAAFTASTSVANTWRDGDGQMISAPPRREQKPASPTLTPPRSTWLDGDGQMISHPPASAASPNIAPTAVVPAL